MQRATRRAQHEERVLDLLRRSGPLTRAELGDLSGLSRTTLYDVVASLVDGGVLTVSVPQDERRKRGRPAERLHLTPAADHVVGVDFGRHEVRVAAYDVGTEAARTAAEPHGPDLPWERRVDIAWGLTVALTGRAPSAGAFKAVGVGLADPGGRPPDATDRKLVLSLVRERFGAVARVEATSRLTALAESAWGAAAGERNMLYVHLSHGVAGGLIVNGALHRGAHGVSGELGHITVVPGGAPCACGRTGCLETVAGISGVLGAYRAAGGAAHDLSGFVASLGAGDGIALAVLEEAGAQVGRVLAGVSNVIGPRVIVIGGELIRTGPTLMNAIRRAFEEHVLSWPRSRISLRPAALAETGPALGAVCQALPQRPTALGRLAPREGGAGAPPCVPAQALGPRTLATV
ncbi:ROK family transcriptional regulator [Streptomyces sp. TS71-3]|uniref:ROK family transcriptional regulator n=1 Tax=Streptomyces sp. TS71-3 TaxID=2733862 RepID=UPI001B0A309A|nr:ROK family transcriptional regulator [Streptomyces sp. TS71-3]GHJ41543.1 transcriptional regulator [Streptomyces sp. TS71-3]